VSVSSSLLCGKQASTWKKEEQLTEIGRSSGRHNFTKRASLEEDWLLSGTSAECKGADCRGRLVFVCRKEVVQALMAKSIQEPLAAGTKGISPDRHAAMKMNGRFI
jgi:hypothetical protein